MRVELLRDQGLDRGDLLVTSLVASTGFERHVGELLGLRLGVVGDRGDPAVVGGRARRSRW